MMSRLVLWTLLLTLRILSCVSARSIPSQQLDKVSRIFLRYSENGTKQDEFVVAWNSKNQEGSLFNTRAGMTSAVFYSLNAKQKYVMDEWPTGACKTVNLPDKGKFSSEKILSSGKDFSLIQLLTGDTSMVIKSCKLRSKIGKCLSDFVCDFVDPVKSSGYVVSNTCTGKVWQAILPRKNKTANKYDTVKYTIKENIENWTDEDWHSAAPYGNSKSIIDIYLVTPSGTYCKGRKMESFKVPKLPKYFSMRVEEVHAHEPEMQKISFKVFDYKNRLVREDFVPDQKHSSDLYKRFGGSVMLRIVEDFNTGSRFVMDTRRGNCSIIPLAIGLFSMSAQHGHQRMRYSFELLDLNVERCWQYSGRVHVRGHPTDRFICQRTFGSYPDTPAASVETVEIYFSTNDSGGGRYGRQASENPVPMLLRHIKTPINKNLKQEFLDYTWHILDFRSEQNDHSLDVFDITTCYNRVGVDRIDYFVIVQAKYETLMKEVGLYSSIRNALAMASNVPPQRITRIRLDSQRDPDYVILWFTLLGHPSAAQQNLHYTMQDRVSLKDAQSQLEKIIGQNLVSIKGAETRYRVMPNSLRTVQKRKAMLSSKETGGHRTTGYTGGNMAALGLCTFGLGTLGTAMAIFCFQRRRRQSAVAYYVKT